MTPERERMEEAGITPEEAKPFQELFDAIEATVEEIAGCIEEPHEENLDWALGEASYGVGAFRQVAELLQDLRRERGGD